MGTTQIQKDTQAEKKDNKFISFLKKQKKLIFLVSGILLLAIAIVVSLSAIKAGRIKAQLENQVYITSGGPTAQREVYAFENGKIATETWYLSSFESNGDINSFARKYKVSASIFSKTAWIMTKYPHGWIKTQAVYLDSNGVVRPYNFTQYTTFDWEKTTLEAVNMLRKESLCDHSFTDTVIKVASCKEMGETKQTCQKCGFEKTITTTASHNYVNKICSVCGQKKQAEKATISANTWYSYKDVLQVQNCLVKEAFSTGGGKSMMVQYYAVCQQCHAIDETSKLSSPEVGYDVERIHTCDECGAYTTVRLRID